MNIKRVRLDQIDWEEHGRKDLDSDRLKESLKEEGLVNPLVVEGPFNNGRYILVEGYRRLYNLKLIGVTTAECNIQDVTSEMERAKKRLKHEFLGRKKTGYERERMIIRCRDRGLSEKEIAEETDIPLHFIKKYLKSVGVPKELKEKAEHAGAGQDGLTKLYHNLAIESELRQKLIFRYIDKDKNRYRETGFFSYHVDSVDIISKCRQFSLLDRFTQEICIYKAIKETRFSGEEAQRIVNKELLNHPDLYDEDTHNAVYEDITCDLKLLITSCNSLFLGKLSGEQKAELHKLVDKLRKVTNTPVFWHFS